MFLSGVFSVGLFRLYYSDAQFAVAMGTIPIALTLVRAALMNHSSTRRAVSRRWCSSAYSADCCRPYACCCCGPPSSPGRGVLSAHVGHAIHLRGAEEQQRPADA